MNRKLHELECLIGILLTLIEEKVGSSNRSMAILTGLSVSTILRLRRGSFSLAIRYNTVASLAESVGLRMVAHKRGLKLEVPTVTKRRAS